MRKALVLAAVAVALVAAGSIYYRVGWNRMTDACGIGDSPLSQRHLDQVPFDDNGERSVRYSWRWSQGFTCTYSNGVARSSFWF